MLMAINESKKISEALAKGKKTYFTLNPCDKGHKIRYTRTQKCKICSDILNHNENFAAQQASIKGEIVYKSFIPCTHGHVERYVKSRACRPCKNTSDRRSRRLEKERKLKNGISRPEKNKNCNAGTVYYPADYMKAKEYHTFQLANWFNKRGAIPK